MKQQPTSQWLVLQQLSVDGSSATTCDQAAFADTPFVVIVAKDAGGNLVPGLTVAASIANQQLFKLQQ